MMRAIWKGHISVGLMTVPVSVYNAVDTSTEISFKQIHAGCGGHVGRTSPCKQCGEIVEQRDILKGYEYAPGEFVTFTKDEIETIKLKSTKIIDVQGFIPLSEIDVRQVDAPYYIAPNGPIAVGPYALVAKALSKRKVAGIGKLVLRHREDAVALLATPDGNGLMMYKLRQPGEVRAFDDVPGVSRVSPPKEQLDLALSLIDSMKAVSMDGMDLRDRYRDTLREIADAKIEKRDIVVLDETQVTKPGDIMEALRASIEAAKSKPQKKETA